MNEGAVLTRLLFYTHHLPTISTDSSYRFTRDMSDEAKSECGNRYFKRNDNQTWCPAPLKKKGYGRYQTTRKYISTITDIFIC